MKPRFLFILALLACGGWLFASGSWKHTLDRVAWLKVKEVTLNVEPPLAPSEFEGLLGQLRGRNLLRVQGNELVQQVMRNPWVASVSVRKEFPDRLVMGVQARKAVATLQRAGRLYFLGEQGEQIGPWSSSRQVERDLPVVSFESAKLEGQWNLRDLVTIAQGIQKALGQKRRVSEVTALEAPYFKVFLTNPKLELLFSQLTWEAQLPFFVDLMRRPPRQIGQAHKINLVFPKKAVVSMPLSH